MSKLPSRSNSKAEKPINPSPNAYYEAWMDRNSIKSLESRVTSTPEFQKKKRSHFEFDKRYTVIPSETPEIPPTPPPPSSQRVTATPQTLKPKKESNTKRQSIATSPIIFEEDYSEFFDWIFNGSEADINPAEIERMLFKTSKNSK